MTRAPHVEPLAVGDLDQAISALRARGLRVSTPRRLVLEALFAAEGPASAEQIARQLTLDLASVYRNLETLERHGLVRHVHLAHGPGLYALLVGGEREYLYCEHCGAVIALDPRDLDDVRARIRDRFGYQVAFAHFALTGRCAGCAAASQAG